MSASGERLVAVTLPGCRALYSDADEWLHLEPVPLPAAEAAALASRFASRSPQAVVEVLPVSEPSQETTA